MMKTFLLTALGSVLCVSATACASPPPTEDTFDGVGIEQAAESDRQFENSLLQIEQISSYELNRDYDITEVEGDDPCLLPENVDLAQCQKSLLSGMKQQENRGRNADTALQEIQAIVPEVIDPDTFDADRTADEFGRSNRLVQSQAGLAVGNQFLMVPEAEDLRPEDGDLTPENAQELIQQFRQGLPAPN
ncbi:MAG: hypothetical protein AAGL11_04000 [Pseudomonadota bacterium]